MPMNQTFNKRMFTPKGITQDIRFFIVNFPKIIKMMQDSEFDRAFMEKIMTVTTAINGCDYCEWFHAKQALKCGISEEEIKNLLAVQFSTETQPHEMMGLLYAQHYAETEGHPDPEMQEQLTQTYGQEKASQILLTIRMINFGNRYGNTWDAALSRLKGVPAQNGHPLFEGLFFLFNFPIMFPAMLVIRHAQKTSA